MPELPEVEIVRRGLASVLVSRTIDRVEIVGVHGARAVRRHQPGPGHFTAVLAGRTVIDVRRRGKYLWWVLDDGDAVLAHLGMSGQFRISSPVLPDGGASERGMAELDGELDDAPAAGLDAAHVEVASGSPGAANRHTRIRFHLTGDGRVVDFVDQRTFGGMLVVPDGAELPAPIAHIARDLLDPAFDQAATVRAIRAKRSSIKRVLLDQTIVSGIGNIYADEALWAARVHYERATGSLAARTVRTVLEAVTVVMQQALEAGGTSFDKLYVDVNGESGYFERSLNVYGRAGSPCRRCGVAIRREAFMNRSSYFCPHCQRRRP